MSFDWPRFLREHHIEFVVERKDNIAIRCPFCGDSDPSHHLGISLRGKGWNCWRNAEHRGKSRARLIQQLLRCSPEEAQRLAYGDSPVPSDDELGEMLSALAGPGAAAPQQSKLAFLPEMKPLRGTGPFVEKFRGYLRKRGYRDRQIEWLAEAYELHYALRGDFANRLIFPLRDRYGALLTWTGRTIREQVTLRYRELGKAEGALASPKDLLLGLPLLWRCPNPKVLVVVEGPLDATRISVFGQALGVYATCLFGLNLSVAQADLLSDLRGRFKHQYLLLDPDAALSSLRVAELVPHVRFLKLNSDAEDPGALAPGDAFRLCADLAVRA